MFRLFFFFFFHISDALERKTAHAPFGRGVQCRDLPRAGGIWEAGGITRPWGRAEDTRGQPGSDAHHGAAGMHPAAEGMGGQDQALPSSPMPTSTAAPIPELAAFH